MRWFAGAGLFDLDEAAELLNFGVCLGFMAVNLSVVGNYCVRHRERRFTRVWANLMCPLAGFVICFYTWLSIALAIRLGALWTVAGIQYLAAQTGGFRRKLSA